MVNWQDRENPQAGGAELHLHEIFGRLARRGHDVTLMCGGWPGCSPTALLDGMQVHRVGTRYTFGWLARGAYKAMARQQRWDLIVEDINKVPLFTPRWGATPVAGVVPHLFGGTAFHELPAPIASIVWLAERPIPWIYRGVPFQVISESTASDLAGRGIPRDDISVIYCGIDSAAYTPSPSERSATPLFAYLGRLKRYKRVDLILQAFAALGPPDARLEIAGEGNHAGALKDLAESLDLGDRVRFLGRVSEHDKVSLLRRSWALVLTSPKEGWGITNLEASASGTPVIASDSPGIRESVRHEETGYLVPHGDVESLTAAMQRVATTPGLVERLGRAGRIFAEAFTWDRAANLTELHLRAYLDGRV